MSTLDLASIDEQLQDALDTLESAEAEVCRRDLHAFMVRVWEIIEPKTKFVDNWHLHELCADLEAVTRGEIKRLIINVPPGTMKTLLVSVIWPAWEWATHPELRYLTASYTSDRTVDANLKLKQIVNSAWYQKHYELKFSGDQNAKERFDTLALGWRIATSVGGVGTGVHPDRIIVDDPTSADQARSDVMRKAANDWFDRTVTTRGVTRDVAIIIVMQRLHESDLTGHVLAKGGDWTHRYYPMRFMTKSKNNKAYRPDPTDPRTVEGQLLWPSLFTETKVRSLEIDLGPYGAAGQLQQQPSPEGGGLFKREWFKPIKNIKELPGKVLQTKRGWDTAATKGDGDYTAGVKIAALDDDTYVVQDVVRGQWSPAEVDAMMKMTAEIDTIDVDVREGKEPGASGKSVISSRGKLLKAFDYAEENTSGDKVTRSKAFRAQCELGNVYILIAPWNEAYLSELSFFPVGNNDDQVDGSSTAYNSIIEDAPKYTSATWGR